jgi:hypothetical protein
MVGDRLSRLFTVAAGFAGMVAVGWIGETGADGGFIKDIWASLKTASPPVAMVTSFGIYILWKEWQKDRGEHAERTLDFNKTLNRYARLLERAAGGKGSKRSDA